MKKIVIEEKINLHSRNEFRNKYDFEKLIASHKTLSTFVFVNEFGTETIDFAKPEAVKALNTAILISNYGIKNWDIPPTYLCPPIPGRCDYIHYLADLLAESNNNVIPIGENIVGLDIGIGANCIYPILGNCLYDWQFVGTDIDDIAIQNCEKIIGNNPKLIDFISLQLQNNSRYIFKDIILPEDKFTFTICNPPFHSSPEEATKATTRKVNALSGARTSKPILNFGGQNAELWTEGGELGFITQKIFESAKYPLQVLWFTTLVSKKEHLGSLQKTLTKVGASTIKIIDMAQGQKTSRILAWNFMTDQQQKAWKF